MKKLLTTHNSSLTTRSGFTLIELLIGSAISTIIFILLINTLIVGLRNRTTSAINTNLQKTATSIMTDITNQARWASNFSLDNNKVTLQKKIDQSTVETTIYELDNGNIVKTYPNSRTSNLNPSDLEVSQFDLQYSPSNSNRLGFSINLEIRDRKQTNKTFKLFSVISVRLSEIGP